MAPPLAPAYRTVRSRHARVPKLPLKPCRIARDATRGVRECDKSITSAIAAQPSLPAQTRARSVDHRSFGACATDGLASMRGRAPTGRLCHLAAIYVKARRPGAYPREKRYVGSDATLTFQVAASSEVISFQSAWASDLAWRYDVTERVRRRGRKSHYLLSEPILTNAALHMNVSCPETRPDSLTETYAGFGERPSATFRRHEIRIRRRLSSYFDLFLTVGSWRHPHAFAQATLQVAHLRLPNTCGKNCVNSSPIPSANRVRRVVLPQ